MATPSVRAASPPRQDDVDHYAGKVLGRCSTSDGVDIDLCLQGGELVLIRPSAGTRRGTEEDIAARVTHTNGVVQVEWNEWHLEVKPSYMPQVEAWTRRQMGVS